MIKASLRKNKPQTVNPVSKSVVIDAEPVEVEGVKVESITTKGEAIDQLLPDPENTHIDLPDETATPTRAVARRSTQTQVAVAGAFGDVEGFEGEWGSDDVKFPQLKIVQGSGPLSTQFDNGTIIYGEEELLPPPSMKEGANNPAIRFVPISIKKQYREVLPEDSAEDEIARVVDTLEEVQELGGTIRYVNNQRPDNFWQKSSRCLLLLEQPEESGHPGFTLEFGRKLYAVAVYYAAGASFTRFTRKIVESAKSTLLVPKLVDGKIQKTASGHIIKTPLLTKCFWTLNFRKEQAGNFHPWRPVVRLLLKEETGQEIRDYCHSWTQRANAGE